MIENFFQNPTAENLEFWIKNGGAPYNPETTEMIAVIDYIAHGHPSPHYPKRGEPILFIIAIR